MPLSVSAFAPVILLKLVLPRFDDSADVFGDMNLLKALLDKNCILKEEYDDFVHMIYEARQENQPLKFDLLEEIENAPE